MHESWSIDREEKRRNYRQKGRENCDCHAHPILSRFSFSLPLRLFLHLSKSYAKWYNFPASAHMNIPFDNNEKYRLRKISSKSGASKLYRRSDLDNENSEFHNNDGFSMEKLSFFKVFTKMRNSGKNERKKCEYTEFLFRIEDTLFKKIKS